MLEAVHLLFLILLAICAYKDYKTRRLGDGWVLAGWVLALILWPSQLIMGLGIGALVIFWALALFKPTTSGWGDVMMAPVATMFCASLFDIRILAPIYIAFAAFIVFNFKKLKEPYPVMMLFFFVYAVMFLATVLLPFYPAF